MIPITAPDYAEARNIVKELEIAKSGYPIEDTPRDRIKALYGERDFPKNL